jgi:hypothetical protein
MPLIAGPGVGAFELPGLVAAACANAVRGIIGPTSERTVVISVIDARERERRRRSSVVFVSVDRGRVVMIWRAPSSVRGAADVAVRGQALKVVVALGGECLEIQGGSGAIGLLLERLAGLCRTLLRDVRERGDRGVQARLVLRDEGAALGGELGGSGVMTADGAGGEEEERDR